MPEKERLSVYDIYVARASEFFGIGKVGRRGAHGLVAVVDVAGWQVMMCC